VATRAAAAWIPDRAEMIWIDYSPKSGKEIGDPHPMLVVSAKAFNERTGIVIGFPMTSAETNDSNPFAVKVIGPDKSARYVLTHQPKSFDWRERDAKPHPWTGKHIKALRQALDELDAICAICPRQM
jgi:mRNA interferase MazF